MADLRLHDLRRGELRSFRRFGPGTHWKWNALPWAECGWCGASSPLAPTEPDGGTYDGEPVVCPECGEVGAVSADEAGCWARWSEDEAGQRLGLVALAAFRRLMREPRAEWWREVLRAG